jgi:aminoglycoside phosphotransferase family enzyme/predicted kinase
VKAEGTLLEGLKRPEAYPHPVERVEVVQTHISYVFLAGDYAYKVKKPLNLGFLDYSTLRKRHFYCRREVELNRRYCPETYLGVVPIIRGREGLQVGGRGRPVEYAVMMRRIPQEAMLDHMVERGEATPGLLASIGRHLAEAHARSPTSPHMARLGTWAIAYAWRENFAQWAPMVGELITAEQDALLRGYVEWFLRRRRPLLRQRAQEGRVRDCHGDLRAESIAILPQGRICIMDCIEFNRRLRYTDVVGDVAFLAMDLERRGRPDLARAFLEAYVEASGDHGLWEVLDFYLCYRAAVRGKVEGIRAHQPEVPAQERAEAAASARRFFELACRYAQRHWPCLIITCGLAGVGKSTLARALGLEMISSDVVRKEIAGLPPNARRPEAFGAGIYSPRMTERTYHALIERGRHLLRQGRWVVLDATFLRRRHREMARRMAAQEGVRFLCVLLEAPAGEVRRRMERREEEGRDFSDARWEIYLAQREAWEPPDDIPPSQLLALDATRPPEELARAVLGFLGR